MITGAVKNKVDKIWLDIFSAGLANPLTVIEQLTYLMFVRALDVKELENERRVLHKECYNGILQLRSSLCNTVQNVRQSGL